MVWNRRAYVGLNYLAVPNLPRYDYKVTGHRYVELSKIAKSISKIIEKEVGRSVDLLEVDYFIWEQLQVEKNLSQIHKGSESKSEIDEPAEVDQVTSQFIQNEIRDKLADIGQWLGFKSATEKIVADGSKVDAVWEATIGNMGRVIYVFEVQTKGSVDSLILNLLKSLNNPAVQGMVAVSDRVQNERIKRHSSGVAGLRDKLKFWDYEEVLQVHEALQSVNEAIGAPLPIRSDANVCRRSWKRIRCRPAFSRHFRK
jgi:hypothetical protein